MKDVFEQVSMRNVVNFIHLLLHGLFQFGLYSIQTCSERLPAWNPVFRLEEGDEFAEGVVVDQRQWQHVRHYELRQKSSGLILPCVAKLAGTKHQRWLSERLRQRFC